MLKIKIMKNIHRRHISVEREVTIWREKQICFDLFQNLWDGMFKPEVIKERMPGLWKNYMRVNISGKNKLIAKLPVEKEMKLVFGMLGGDTFQVFKRKPANSLKIVFNQ